MTHTKFFFLLLLHCLYFTANTYIYLLFADGTFTEVKKSLNASSIVETEPTLVWFVATSRLQVPHFNFHLTAK